MTDFNKEKIIEKLRLMKEYAAYLKTLAEETKKDRLKFKDDFHLFGPAERYLQLSIQAIIDTVQLVVIDEGLEKPDENQEAIVFLFEKKIISSDLAEKLDGIVGFRNILVHEYGKIDKERVYDYLQEKIGDLEQFQKEILKYCKK